MPTFLNVDFEFIAEKDLSIITQNYGDELFVLFNQKIDGLYYLSFEMSSSSSLDKILEKFFDWLENLPPKHRLLLLSSRQKLIDIGFESDEEQTLVSKISFRLLQKMAEMDFELAITFYPATD